MVVNVFCIIIPDVKYAIPHKIISTVILVVFIKSLQDLQSSQSVRREWVTVQQMTLEQPHDSMGLSNKVRFSNETSKWIINLNKV